MPQSYLQNSKELLAGVDESRANKQVIKLLPFWIKLYTLTACYYMISDVSGGARFLIQLNLNLLNLYITKSTVERKIFFSLAKITITCMEQNLDLMKSLL